MLEVNAILITIIFMSSPVGCLAGCHNKKEMIVMTDDKTLSSNASADALRVAGRELVHGVGTPLATLQMNLQVLSVWLPELVDSYRAQSSMKKLTDEQLKAIAQIPAALDADIGRIRHLTQDFVRTLVPQASEHTQAISSMNPQNIEVQRILLVEDEEIHQQITQKQLNHSVALDVASNGIRAAELCADIAYDVILMDFMVPGMDVKRLISHIRQTASKEAIVIMVSNMPLTDAEWMALGAQGALTKPFRKEALLGLLNKGT